MPEEIGIRQRSAAATGARGQEWIKLDRTPQPEATLNRCGLAPTLSPSPQQAETLQRNFRYLVPAACRADEVALHLDKNRLAEISIEEVSERRSIAPGDLQPEP